MKKYQVLFNPLANNKKGLEGAKQIEKFISGSFTYTDLTTVENFKDLLDQISLKEIIVIAGGDGTLNRLINKLDDVVPNRDLYYFATGSGNDFLTDTGKNKGELVLINPYLKDLPKVTVNGRTQYFLNGVGYGIDGYCCEIGDKMREEAGDKKINYTAIAIKGLLFHYKPTGAKIVVDGVEHTYKKVWLSPVMNGKFYGGGMMIAPEQDRLSEGKNLSVVVLHDSGKLKTLIAFPSIFKGEHVLKKDMFDVLEGKDITMEFDRPTPLQIDGEVVSDVLAFRATAQK